MKPPFRRSRLYIAFFLPGLNAAAAFGADEGELRYWLENALGHHRFTVEEAALATGLGRDEVERRAREWTIAPLPAAPLPQGDPKGEPLKVLPYPGGRHPRIGFLDGAVDPRRETKASVFLPWQDGGYVVIDLPEAVFSERGLIYLAHKHIPTVWDAQKIELPKQEWRRGPGGELSSTRVLPDGVAFGARIVPKPDGADLELWIRNGTDEPLRKVRCQMCLMLKGAPGFEAQTNDNKVKVALDKGEVMAARSADGRRWIALVFERSRAWGNPPCPCLHSDPTFPDCPPGATMRTRGRLLAGEAPAGFDLASEARARAESAWASLADPLSAQKSPAPPRGLRAGAAAKDIAADDDMVIGGGIGPGRVSGQEGKLRAAAIALRSGDTTLAVVACDILMMRRDYLDQAANRIAELHGIPASNVLINATHTHHAPSTVTIHGYRRDEAFCARTRDAIVEAAGAALRRLEEGGECELAFAQGESTVGQNSRLLLADGTIFWIGPRDDEVRPTGPFDPDLQLLALRRPGGKLEALLFNHSTHCIGVREPGKRSPGFYGLAAQDLEAEVGGTAVFVAGAFGSTHNLTLTGADATARTASAIRAALGRAVPRDAGRLRSLKREVEYKVRDFDEAKEDAAVTAYCRKRAAGGADYIIDVFRKMRAELASQRGETRRTWVQALRIGDVAMVGIPGELFTKLGIDIKRGSPFRHTLVAGVANDYVGYIPDRDAYDLGGYQVWTGFHSLVERGTGEMLVEEALKLLEELSRE